MTDPVALIAAELIELGERPRLLSAFSARYPGLDAAAGYRAAERLHAHRLAAGWKPVGRKIGFTNRTIWARYGVYEPIWGYVYDQTIVHARARHAEVELAGLVQPRIEPEVCFGLKTSPRSSDPASLLEAIEWVAHSVEIVHCHHPEWKLQIADCTAANGLHGRLVLGAPVALRELPDLGQALPGLEVALMKGGVMIDRGVGTNVLDSPLLALGHLVGMLTAHPEHALRAGEIVSTGTLTDAHAVAAGETWTTDFSGLALPGLSVTFR
jgi:2-oxo-3-hexenedioate decarboxylase